jgi:hypothetical protein
MPSHLVFLIIAITLAVPAWAGQEVEAGGEPESTETEQAITEELNEDETAAAAAVVQDLSDDDSASEEEIDEESNGEGADDQGEDEVADDEDADDSDLDIQTYEEDEDIFIPTEEIPSDEPIPFPSNI